ncbi:hypothetical protein CYY_007367 [Polysphondylium violaceum]|uniref:Poly [ADP-ribose] polymerase n=1 Tax=Polysphondylium violaceum TaxID=133409 RepID=A0A8J4PQI9_9MYCE|nr:hypothetical protein CYY_007367 [Polysphondylium violaceum]
MSSLEIFFTDDAPKSLVDSISFSIFKDPLLVPCSGRTYSKSTLIGCNGVEPMVKKPFKLEECIAVKDKEEELDSFFENQINGVIKTVKKNPTIDELVKLLQLYPLLCEPGESRDCCLNGQRNIKEVLEDKEIVEKFMSPIHVREPSLVKSWKQLINFKEPVQQQPSLSNSTSSFTNNGFRTNSKKIQFLINNRKEELSKIEELYQINITRDSSLAIQCVTVVDLIKDQIETAINTLVQDWCEETIFKSAHTKLCEAIQKKIEARNKHLRDVCVKVDLIPSFEDGSSDMSFSIYGVTTAVQNEFQTIKKSVDPYSSTPTCNYASIKGFAQDPELLALLDKNSAILVDEFGTYHLHTKKQSEWDTINNFISNKVGKANMANQVPASPDVAAKQDNTDESKLVSSLGNLHLSPKKHHHQKQNKALDKDSPLTCKKGDLEYIKAYLLPKWVEKTSNTSVCVLSKEGSMALDKSLPDDVLQMIKADISHIFGAKSFIKLPYSSILFRDMIIEKARSKKCWLKWSDKFCVTPSYWVSHKKEDKEFKKKKNYKDGGKDNNKDSKDMLLFTIIGNEKDNVFEVKRYIEDLKKNYQEIVLNEEQKKIRVDWKQFQNKERNIFFDKGIIKIEAISQELLKESIKLVKTQLGDLTKYNKTLSYEEYEIEYLRKKEIITNLQIQYPNAHISLLGKKAISIDSSKKEVFEILNNIKLSLNNFVMVEVDLTDKDLQPKVKLLSKVVLQKAKFEKDDDVIVIVNSLKNNDKHIDLTKIQICGCDAGEVEKKKREFILAKDSIHCEDYIPANIKDVINVLRNQKDKIAAIEEQFNSTISSAIGVVRIASENKATCQLVENELQALVSQKPNDSKIVSVTKFLWFKFSNSIKPIEAKAKDLGIRFHINVSENIVTLGGDPEKVKLIYQELLEKKQDIEKLIQNKQITIDRMTHDLLFHYKKLGELQKKTYALVKLHINDVTNSLVFSNGKKIVIKHGDITLQKTDAIVNPCNSKLFNAGGAARHIEKAAGPEFKQACQDFIDKNGEIKVGLSLGGVQFKLGNSFIINTVGPNTNIPEENTHKEQLLINSVVNSVVFAEKLGCKTLALPAISSGIFGYNIKDSASVLLKAAFKALSESKTFEEVHFVDLNETIVGELDNQLTLLFKPQDNKPINTNNSITLNNYVSIKRQMDHYWTWRENDGSDNPYDEDQCYQIEDAYNKRLPSVVVTGDRGQVKNGQIYEVFFPDYNNPKTWYQLNTVVKYNKRLVQRKPKVDVPAKPTSSLPVLSHLVEQMTGRKPQPLPQAPYTLVKGQKKTDNETFVINVSGFADNVKNFETELAKLVSSQSFKETLPKLGLSPQMIDEIKKESQKIGVSITSQDDGSFTLKGIKENVFEIKSLFYEKSNSYGAIQYPTGWDKTNKKGLIQLSNTSQEFADIQNRIRQTLPNARVHQVKIVQNDSAFNDYHYNKKKLELKLGRDSEILLFHGTRNTSPDTICYSDECFDSRYSNENCLWGTGSYFAVNASYSLGYSYNNTANGMKEFFLAKVLIGDTIQLPENKSLRYPPSKENSLSKYDSVKGHREGSDIYIIYGNGFSYPYYLISYTAN